MKKENYLDKKPKIKKGILWETNESGEVTLKIENKKIYRIIFNLPEANFVKLDLLGSFMWLMFDGKRDVYEIGKNAKEFFGDTAEPLYERLVVYLKILKSYNFIEWVREKKENYWHQRNNLKKN